METLALAPTCRHSRLRVETRQSTEFIDITDRVAAMVAATRVDDALVNIQTLHTTTAVVVNEHEPLLLVDFATLLARVAPPESLYRHDDIEARTVNLAPGERPNGHAHCQALLLGCSALLNVADGRLQLGRWQRIFFVEMDGPRSREISILVLAATGFVAGHSL